MGRYFGTDGFRGEANNNLTADHAYKIGRFLGWYYGEIKRQNGDDTPARIVIGKDTRRSSYMFEYTLVGGLVASGADAYLLHVTTTPSVAYVARTDEFDCGIMISASHNPYYDNGIKLINGNGEALGSSSGCFSRRRRMKPSIFAVISASAPLSRRSSALVMMRFVPIKALLR